MNERFRSPPFGQQRLGLRVSVVLVGDVGRRACCCWGVWPLAHGLVGGPEDSISQRQSSASRFDFVAMYGSC